MAMLFRGTLGLQALRVSGGELLAGCWRAALNVAPYSVFTVAQKLHRMLDTRCKIETYRLRCAVMFLALRSTWVSSRIAMQTTDSGYLAN